MIKKLFVQNIFLIENLELEFTSGLNVLTGETGAGKSILLDCLGYLLGKKNTRIELGNRAETATLIGEFQSEKNSLISQFLSEKGFSIEGNLILKSKNSHSKINLKSGDGLGFEVNDCDDISIDTEKELDFLLFSMPSL